jgi:prophage DNA circulation protein
MNKIDAVEGALIVESVLTVLLAQVPGSGRSGANFRTMINAIRVNAEVLLHDNTIGPPLESVFRQAQANGVTLPQMEVVRLSAAAQAPVTVGAMLVRDSLLQYALAAQGMIISSMTFVSRDDVEALRPALNSAFADSEELAADAMESMTYQALTGLHAAISYYLTQAAQPLPRMLSFAFATPLPTLVASYRLYSDASHADELRDQNHVVHPAFMRPTGRALSS